MTRQVFKTPQNGDLTQRIRRQANASRLAAAAARLAGRKALRNRQTKQTADLGEQHVDQESFRQDYEATHNMEELEMINDEEGDSTNISARDEENWVTLDEGIPDEVDAAIESTYERYRQEALQFNWNFVTQKLHAVYMKQKLHTKNWLGGAVWIWLISTV
ncbi:hypothetical protein PGT21_007340 [Puccinia graminis f. sp. tritici]|uniref:Uncharacterized protein n=1 Tax=Puccinia graminis f. sp. tritici TaxID=56615 RepID=A0A5B0P1V2_PUCGR|nr:hypothetical protein PGT21_007340 [Puccinia graminis f. sp. tritici]